MNKLLLKKLIPSIIISSSTLMTVPLISNGDTITTTTTTKLPKMEYFVQEDNMKVGKPLYNEINLELVDSKLKSIINDWNNMINKVELLLKKNKKIDAQNTISNTMGSLKTNMRNLSKVLSNGDIIVRNENGNEINAEFNFNTGQFKLKAIAQKTEDVISAVNDFYFYESQETIESSLIKLKSLENIFEEYVKVLINK
jgi:hypothetical protein